MVQGSTLIEVIMPFKDSVLTSSPLNINETHSANAALLAEIITGGALSTPARNYAQCVIRRSKRSHVRTIIVEEKYEKLKGEVTKRKTILSDKRQVLDEKHHLTTSKILIEFRVIKKNIKKKKIFMAKKGKWEIKKVKNEFIDKFKANQDERLKILDYIMIKFRDN